MRHYKHSHRHDHHYRHEHEHTQEEGLGPGGICVCPKCGEKAPHQGGMPCQEEKCPKCGAKMLREGSYHHQLFEKRKNDNGRS